MVKPVECIVEKDVHHDHCVVVEKHSSSSKELVVEEEIDRQIEGEIKGSEVPTHNLKVVDLDDTEIVHISKKFECAIISNFGRREIKALWDSGAGRCILSYDSYQKINHKYKTPLFDSDIRIKAANGTFIKNRGECDLTFHLGKVKFTFNFLCSDELTQDIILGYDFVMTHQIGTTWTNNQMLLTQNGAPFTKTLPTNDISAIVNCAESLVIPPYCNANIVCRIPLRGHREYTYGKQCIFEPSLRHRTNYHSCDTYAGIVTMDEEVMKSGKFCITMTNKSHHHVKMHEGQTVGLIKNCPEGNITTIHKIVTFDKVLDTKGQGKSNTLIEQEEDFYCIPLRNKKTGLIEVETVLKGDTTSEAKTYEIGIHQDFVRYSKPNLKNAPINRKTQLDLDKLLENNDDAFAKDERHIGTTPLIKMDIDTGNAEPVSKRPYSTPLKHQDFVLTQIDKLLEAGVIRESLSSWSAPIVVVPKGDGGKRLVVDYRGLNDVTRTFIWPMPRVEDIFAKLGKAKFFSCFDITAGYHHIALELAAIHKTAFVTHNGKYEYLRVPFGLAQAPAYFQKLMNQVLKGLDFTLAYLDDIIIFSETEEQHLHHIEIVLARLKEANLKLKRSKCEFFKQELHYLGHILTTEGIRPQAEKVKAISEMKAPRNARGVREFLGTVGYYRKFILKFADAARPLTQLTRKAAKFVWENECQLGYDYLRECLISAPILKYPDPQKRYVLFTDASDDAASAVLTQEYPDNGGDLMEMPVAFISVQFSDTQYKWSTIVKEGYAIYYANKKWRNYLEGAEILLKSDAKSLVKFLKGKTDNCKLDRWSLELQDRNITIEHIPGHKNKAADCLSRLPFVPRKRNDNPLKDEIAHVTTDTDTDSAFCPLCEVELTDTKGMQKSDHHCKRIANLLENPKSKFHERDSYGYDDSGILYKVNIEKGREYKATVVPKVLVPTVLKEMHDHFGHFGVGKTYSLIKRYYYWPKMIRHIQAHIDACSLCRREKMQADKYQLQTTEVPNRPFAKVSIDLIVEQPLSHQGNINILVMVDHLTGWPMAKAIPNKEAETVASAIFEKLILTHGSPEILLADNGTEFTNDTLHYVCQEFNIEQHFTSPYTPRSNGKVENFNKFLKGSIRKLCQEDKQSWDQVIDQILWAYRCCPHTSTGESPYTLLYAMDPPLPIQKLITVVEPYRGESTLAKKIEKSRVALSIASKMLHKMRENQKRHYMNRRSVHQFQVGDLVLFKNHTPEKLDFKWIPNYRVIKLTSSWSAVIENQINGRTRRCNVGDLKHKHPSEDWELKASSFGRAARFVNHPDNLPDVDFIPEKVITDQPKTKHNLRQKITAPNKLNL